MTLWRNQKIRGWIYQIAALLLVALCVAILADNTLENMRTRGIQSGFGFLSQPAGFDISESLFGFESTQPYWKAFLTGLGNTLKVALIGIILTTILGVLLGVGRFSQNILIRGLCLTYVEIFRNVPLLLQLLMWYLLLVEFLPTAREAEPFLGMFLTKAGLTLPWFGDMPVKAGFGIKGGINVLAGISGVVVGVGDLYGVVYCGNCTQWYCFCAAWTA